MLGLLELKYFNSYIWWVYSMVSFFPLLFLSVYKLLNPINIHKYNDHNPFPRHFQDKLARVFLFWGIIYYFFDVFLSLLIQNFSNCGISFFVHHGISLVFLPAAIFQNYYPWYICLVPCIHALLMVFPEVDWLNYIYLAGCGLYQYGLYQEPYKNMRKYKILQMGTWLLELSLVMLWAFGCKNTFE